MFTALCPVNMNQRRARGIRDLGAALWKSGCERGVLGHLHAPGCSLVFTMSWLGTCCVVMLGPRAGNNGEPCWTPQRGVFRPPSAPASLQGRVNHLHSPISAGRFQGGVQSTGFAGNWTPQPSGLKPQAMLMERTTGLGFCA